MTCIDVFTIEKKAVFILDKMKEYFGPKMLNRGKNKDEGMIVNQKKQVNKS
jgi:hypothetical protein